VKQVRFWYGLLFACVAFAGCSGGALSPGPGSNATAPRAAMRALSMTMARYVQPIVHTDFGKSWMLPQKKGAKAALIYAGDEETNDVYVYDYSDGKIGGNPYGV
jgi:hypothetical protein